MNTPKTKIRYIQDKRNPDRIMTLVTRVEGEVLTCAVSVNMPPVQAVDQITETTFITEMIPGDSFDKEKGKRIALGRLDCDRDLVRYTEDINIETQHPLVLALELIARDRRERSIASRRIAQSELKKLRKTTPSLFAVRAPKYTPEELQRASANM